MAVLSEKLLKELPDDARVISCRFPIPDWPVHSTVGSGLDQTFAYDISSVRSLLVSVPKAVVWGFLFWKKNLSTQNTGVAIKHH